MGGGEGSPQNLKIVKVRDTHFKMVKIVTFISHYLYFTTIKMYIQGLPWWPNG